MGKSRSTTILIAYLLSAGLSSSPVDALDLIRRNRPFAEPNSGFMSQLEMYREMHCPMNLDDEPVYQHWLYQRNVEASNACGVAPNAEDIHFGNLSLGPNNSTESPFSKNEVSQKSAYRCRRCRTPLATSEYLIRHEHRLAQQMRSKGNSNAVSSANPPRTVADVTAKCAHLFLDPLSWMRAELEKGLLSGRLECPNEKCSQNVGKYAWQGMKCSCGEWVVPGICIARAKVDEILEGRGSDARI